MGTGRGASAGGVYSGCRPRTLAARTGKTEADGVSRARQWSVRSEGFLRDALGGGGRVGYTEFTVFKHLDPAKGKPSPMFEQAAAT